MKVRWMALFCQIMNINHWQTSKWCHGALNFVSLKNSSFLVQVACLIEVETLNFSYFCVVNTFYPAHCLSCFHVPARDLHAVHRALFRPRIPNSIRGFLTLQSTPYVMLSVCKVSAATRVHPDLPSLALLRSPPRISECRATSNFSLM